MYEIESYNNFILGYISLDLVCKYHLFFLLLLDFWMNYSYDVLNLRKYFT